MFWTVQIARGDTSRAATVTTEKYTTKREALDSIKSIPYSYIKRMGRTYTIYAKGK